MNKLIQKLILNSMKCFFLILCLTVISSLQAQESLFNSFKLVKVHNKRDSTVLFLNDHSKTNLYVIFNEVEKKKNETRYLFSFIEFSVDSNGTEETKNKWDFVIHKHMDKLRVGWVYSKYPTIMKEAGECLNYLWLNLNGEILNILLEKDLLIIILDNGLELSFIPQKKGL